MVTIKDVAKAANVSISTVSYALNNSGSVKQETKEKIINIAKELGYEPNGIARSLKTKKTGFIGFFVNAIEGPIYTEILRGVRDVAENNGYEVVVGECLSKNSKITKLITHNIVDGAVILATSLTDIKIKSISKDLKLVVLDREIEDSQISSIVIDNENAAFEVVKLFSDLGYESAGIISGPRDSYDNRMRVKGFESGIKNFKIKTKGKWNKKGEFTEQSGYEQMKKIIETTPMPRAIFIANDEMAIGALQALKENDIKVPEEVAVVGFDDIKLGQYVSPTLTTVHRPSYDLGVLAAYNLFNKLKGSNEKSVIKLTTELIRRESC